MEEVDTSMNHWLVKGWRLLFKVLNPHVKSYGLIEDCDGFAVIGC